MHKATFSVDIISPTTLSMEFQTALKMTGPAMDMGVAHLRKQHGDVFKVRHKAIYNINTTSCSEQADFMDDMLSRYYYRKSPTNSTVLIFPGAFFLA